VLYFVQDRACVNCAAWNYTHDTLKFGPPPDFPAEQVPADGYLRPEKLTFDKIKDAVHVAHDAIVNEEWTTKVQIHAYLTHWKINDKVCADSTPPR
jgi:hypothetical protein